MILRCSCFGTPIFFQRKGLTLRNNLLTVALVVVLFGVFICFAWADDDTETKSIRSSCTDGNSFACFRMGERYRLIEKDNKIALQFYRKACDADYMTGCTNGGILTMRNGTQYSKHWKEAKKMFQKACDAGEDTSCFNLGSLNYREGRQKKAIKFYQQACKMGNPGGCGKEKRLRR